MRRIFAAVFVLACSDPSGPKTQGVRYSVSSTYAEWWRELEQCSGLRRDIGQVAFYVVDSVPGQAVARYQFAGGKQTIEIMYLFVNDEPVVKHEMMHALLYNAAGHPAEYFNGKCGDLRNGNTY